MRTDPDWRQIGTAFQTTRKSTREIAREHGISEAAIRKRAKQHNWTRPEAEPDWGEPMPVATRQDRAPSFEAAVPQSLADAAMAEPAELVKRGRGIILALMSELEIETANIHLLAELVEIETAEDSGPNRRRALQKALSLPVRTQAAKNLATALASLRDEGTPDGKKAQRQASAEASASEGRFAVPDAPKALRH